TVELAHGAAHALLVLHHGDGGGDAAVADEQRGRRLHRDAVERAAVHAVHAAGALLELDVGLGPLLRLHLLAEDAVAVEDRVVGTDHAARPAVDAVRVVDVVHL